jgi:AcrR family transcriptional regulator
MTESPVKRTRRRGAELEQAILDAAWAELDENGWAGFTMEAVAARCGTAKPVLYRRWANRAELAREMLMRATQQRAGLRSTGDLRDDLLRYLVGAARFLRGPFGEAARGIVAAGVRPDDPDRAASDATGPLRDVLAAAVARGDLAAVPSDLVVNVGHFLVVHELVQTGRAPSDERVRAIVDDVWLPALRATASA